MRFRRYALVTVFLLGCGKTLKPPPAPVGATVVDMARDRPVPASLRSRVQVSVESDAMDASGSTGGGVLIDRPGRGRLDVFGPLGASMFVLATDGEGLDILFMRDDQHIYADAAEEAVREATGGSAGLDDLLAVVQGDLPFDEAEVMSITHDSDGIATAVLEGPRGTTVLARIDPQWGTPLAVEVRDGDGVPLLHAAYSGYTPVTDGGPLLPDELVLTLPAMELVAGLKFKNWAVVDEVPDAFSPEVPEGFASTPLEAVAWPTPPDSGEHPPP